MKLLIVGPVSCRWSLVKSYFCTFNKIDSIEIFLFDPEQEGLFKRIYKDGFLNRIRRRVYYYVDSCILNRKFISFVKSEKCRDLDLILDIKSYWLTPKILKMSKRYTNALIFHLNPDSPFDKSNFHLQLKRCMPFYDCYFIWHKGLIPKLYEIGAERVEYLPFAWDSELHPDKDVSLDNSPEYTSDIAFIGNWSPEREKWLETLSDLNLAIWGGYLWGRLKKSSPLLGRWKRKIVVGEEFVKVCRSSKIILNFLRPQNKDSHNMRTFEIPGCGGFMLHERSRELADFFREDKDVACFSTPQELREKINYYLTHNEERERMAKSAHRKMQNRTYLDRARRILEVCRNQKESRK